MDPAALLEPLRLTAHLPGLRGTLRARPEDFRVEEMPAYPADGAVGKHALLPLTKRNLTTEAALGELAVHLHLPRGAIGVAGLKDRAAVTTQWVSIPAAAVDGLGSFRHPDIELGPAQPHRNKLRRGHLLGNRFTLTVRDLDPPGPDAKQRVDAKLAALAATGGLLNLFGEQRFGPSGKNVTDGFEILAQGRPRRRDQFVLSAAQSALFNAYVMARGEDGLLRTVLRGDVLRKRETGGLFVCTDPATDQARLQAGELDITGPIFGSKMRAAEHEAAAREAAVLAAAGVEPAWLAALGRNAPGSRRVLQVEVGVTMEDAPAVEDLSAGLVLRFSLPAGSYATQLWGELTCGGEPR